MSPTDSLAARIQAAIDAQQQEVNRLQTAATVDLPAAQQKLNQLQQMLARDTPVVETFFANLFSAGIVK